MAEAHLPTGLAGAAFWVAVWFGWLLFVRRFLGAHRHILSVLCRYSRALLLWPWPCPSSGSLFAPHMLWSLRNKLVLTYLLIGLAPVVLFVTLASVLAYIAAGQFAIHLADSRIQTELNQMSNENRHRTDLVDANARMTGRTTRPNVRAPPSRILREAKSWSKIDRVGNRLRRETQGLHQWRPRRPWIEPSRQGPLRPATLGDRASRRSVLRSRSR